MQKMVCKLFVLCGMSPPSVARVMTGGQTAEKQQGLSIPLSIGEQTFENSSDICGKNETCDLKKVIFRKEDYLIPPVHLLIDDDTIQSTRVLVGFITNEIADLTRYAFVQFTRGCMWHSYVNDRGVLDTEFGVLRNFLGIKQLQHVFPRWVVDSDDKRRGGMEGATRLQ